jgi:hypothetical protein
LRILLSEECLLVPQGFDVRTQVLARQPLSTYRPVAGEMRRPHTSMASTPAGHERRGLPRSLIAARMPAGGSEPLQQRSAMPPLNKDWRLPFPAGRCPPPPIDVGPESIAAVGAREDTQRSAGGGSAQKPRRDGSTWSSLGPELVGPEIAAPAGARDACAAGARDVCFEPLPVASPPAEAAPPLARTPSAASAASVCAPPVKRATGRNGRLFFGAACEWGEVEEGWRVGGMQAVSAYDITTHRASLTRVLAAFMSVTWHLGRRRQHQRHCRAVLCAPCGSTETEKPRGMVLKKRQL